MTTSRGERNDAVLSALAAGEILVRPHRDGTARSVAFEILDMPGLTIRSVDFLVAAEAARMCAESSLRLPDAIVLATGILAGATYLVTNDRRLAAAAPGAGAGHAGLPARPTTSGRRTSRSVHLMPSAGIIRRR